MTFLITYGSFQFDANQKSTINSLNFMLMSKHNFIPLLNLYNVTMVMNMITLTFTNTLIDMAFSFVSLALILNYKVERPNESYVL